MNTKQNGKISIIAPIKRAEDIKFLAQSTSCRIFYVYYHKFLDGGFDKIHDFIKAASEFDSKIYVNFKHNIFENNLPQILDFIEYLKTTQINGIFVNSYAILEALKRSEMPFKVIIDSYFDIHNISGIEFLKTFQKPDGLIITEEIYTRNITKIKQFTHLPLAIDTDNLPWCINDIKKSKAISLTVIKGDFGSKEEVCKAVKYIENVIEFPELYKNKKLPFKHVRKGLYKTNHFTGEILSTQGKDFKFSKNIIPYEWNCKNSRLNKNFDYKSLNLPHFCLRLSSIEQIKKLKSFIEKIGFNPIYSIEYGEIISTSDLAKKSFTQVIEYVKKFCFEHGIFLSLSTPKILIERDFDRVFEYVKQLCLEFPYPNAVIANNIGYFWEFINDAELNNLPIEIGYGINLLNSMSMECLCGLHKIDAIDLSVIKDKEQIKRSLDKINFLVPRRKLTIAGNVRIPCLGLCPLNTDSAINSRLSCMAPCQRGTFAISDPSLEKLYPIVPDGFCRMHMYKDKIINLFAYTDEFSKWGINEFVLDLNNLGAKFVPIILTDMLNSQAGIKVTPPDDLGEYNL